MINMKNFAKMRELRGQGLSYSAIGRELGVGRKTVAQYLKSNVPPRYGPREVKTKEDHFGEFESMVRNQIREVPRWTAAEIFEWLAARGYKGSQRTVARRLQVIKGEKAKERYFEQVYEPGRLSLILRNQLFCLLPVAANRFIFMCQLYLIQIRVC